MATRWAAGLAAAVALASACQMDGERKGPAGGVGPGASPRVTAAAEEPDFDCDNLRGGGRAAYEVATVLPKGGIQYRFKPARLVLPAGETVSVRITNPSDIGHDFSAGSCYSGVVDTGHAVTVRFRVPDQPLDFTCSLHNGMDGRIVPEA